MDLLLSWVCTTTTCTHGRKQTAIRGPRAYLSACIWWPWLSFAAQLGLELQQL